MKHTQTFVRQQVDFLEDFDPGQVSDQGGGEDPHRETNGYGYGDGVEEESPGAYSRQPY